MRLKTKERGKNMKEIKKMVETESLFYVLTMRTIFAKMLLIQELKLQLKHIHSMKD